MKKRKTTVEERVGMLNRLHNSMPKNPLLMSVKDIKALDKKQKKILKS